MTEGTDQVNRRVVLAVCCLSVCLTGIGITIVNVALPSIIVATFTEPRQRARAVGVWGSTIGVTLAAGPVLGGVRESTTTDEPITRLVN